jgi:glycine cleavage system H protein
VESVKAVSDLYAPISGEVIEINEALLDAPEGINNSPYDTGWMIVLRPSDPAEVNSLMDAAAYEAANAGH